MTNWRKRSIHTLVSFTLLAALLSSALFTSVAVASQSELDTEECAIGIDIGVFTTLGIPCISSTGGAGGHAEDVCPEGAICFEYVESSGSGGGGPAEDACPDGTICFEYVELSGSGGGGGPAEDACPDGTICFEYVELSGSGGGGGSTEEPDPSGTACFFPIGSGGGGGSYSPDD